MGNSLNVPIPFPISVGGTNSSSALVNGRMMVSSGDSVVEGTITVVGGALGAITTITTSDHILIGNLRIDPFSDGQAVITHEAATDSWMNISPQSTSGSGTCDVSLFRSTTTSGARRLRFYRGDGSAATNGFIQSSDSACTASFTNLILAGGITGVTTIDASGLISAGAGVDCEGNNIINVGSISLDLIAKDDIVTGDNFINITGNTTDTTLWIRHRIGGASSGYSGTCYSNFDSTHFFEFNNSTVFTIRSSTQNSATPDPDGGTVVDAFTLTTTGVAEFAASVEAPAMITSSITAAVQDVDINIGASGHFNVNGANKGRMVFNELDVVSLKTTMGDDNSHSIAAGKAGRGIIIASDFTAWIDFYFTSLGAVVVHASGGTIATTNSDGFFCVYDAGTNVNILNRLGFEVEVMIQLWYFTP